MIFALKEHLLRSDCTQHRTKMATGGTKNSVLALLLKSCNLVEMTCKLGTSATQSLVGCLEETQRGTEKSVQHSVKATLLTSTARLAQGVSDEVISLLRVPRMGVDLYEVRQLHPSRSCSLVLQSEPDYHVLRLTGTSHRSAKAPSQDTPGCTCEG